MVTIQNIMSTLSSRIAEAVEVAKQRGYVVADIAKECGISVQSIYQWLDPLNAIKELKASSILGLSKLSGLSPWYINDGTGDKVLYFARNEPQKDMLMIMEKMDIKDQPKMREIGNTSAKHPKENNGTNSTQ